jgi:hypothetical protein
VSVYHSNLPLCSGVNQPFLAIFFVLKQICEQLHDDSGSGSFSEICQDADVDITQHSDPDAEINKPDLSDSGGNSDDSQESANVSNDDDGGGGR